MSGAGDEQAAGLGEEVIGIAATQVVVGIEAEFRGLAPDLGREYRSCGVGGAVFAIGSAGHDYESVQEAG